MYTDSQKIAMMQHKLVQMLRIRDFHMTQTSKEQVKGDITEINSKT